MRLDNEASEDDLSMLEDEGLTMQLAPPCNHRKNLAKCAIQTYKNHLITGVSGANPYLRIEL